MTTRFRGKVITAGYEWVIRLSFANSGVSFAPDAAFKSQVRRDPRAEDVLAEMTTENGGITRVDATTLDLKLTAAQTEGWPDRTAFLDVIQTDTDPHQHLGFQLRVPVRQSITRG